MNTVHNTNGRFGYKGWSFEKKVCFWIMILCAAFPIGHMGIMKFLNTIIGKELTYIATPMVFAEEVKTIDQMKSDVLDRLAKCESGGKETTIVFDSNGKASVGNYQWQLASFRHYYEKMTGKKITDREAAIMALDDVKARELASYVIFETEKGGSRDWVNCFNWHDLDTLVKFIKAHD